MDIQILSLFICAGQLEHIIKEAVNSDEFSNNVERQQSTFEEMPTACKGAVVNNNTTVHLHYFLGNMDWFITHKSTNKHNVGCMHGYICYESGHHVTSYTISISSILKAGAELDLEWEPMPLWEVKKVIAQEDY